jgi:hypothetical protein
MRVKRFATSLGWGADKNGDAVWARDFDALARAAERLLNLPPGEDDGPARAELKLLLESSKPVSEEAP